MPLCHGCDCLLDSANRSGWCGDCAEDLGGTCLDVDEPDYDDRAEVLEDAEDLDEEDSEECE